MRGLLRRLKCNNYKILVAASSIIRPGVAQSGMMKEYILDTTTRPVRIFSWNIQRTSGRNLWCYGVSGRCNKIALHFGSTRLWWMFAPRWVVKDALWLRYKSKRQFFLHVVLKRTSLSTESRNIQTNNRLRVLLLRRTRPLMPLKAIKVYT
jgi:hypothetical protein